jgi:hypothetical protein
MRSRLLASFVLVLACGDRADDGGSPATNERSGPRPEEGATKAEVVADAPAASATKAAPEPIAFEDSPEGLIALVQQLVPDDGRAATVAASLRLPDPEGFFAARFEADVAEDLLAQYDEFAPSIASLPGRLALEKARGNIEILVERFKDQDDPKATGLQGEVLEAMKIATPLYSVRMSPPGQGWRKHFYNFVYVDGGFRCVGSLSKVMRGKPEAYEKEVAALLELRQWEAAEWARTGIVPR